MQTPDLSIVLPARDEEQSLDRLLREIKRLHPEAEVVVVNDGSQDKTGAIADMLADIVVDHPYPIGNGAAVKNGARHANGRVLVFMDADGQHAPQDISRLVAKLAEGYTMVVGARHATSHANLFRRYANLMYNKMASILTGRKIADLTSGMRAVDSIRFKQFLYLLPNGFSYPATITMAFLRCGYPLAYLPITAGKRAGKSKINPARDGLRFFLIILKIGSLYSPLRLFIPLSMLMFLLGLGYYIHTFMSINRLTNMSVILFISALLIFLIGIVAEQISALHYLTAERNRDIDADKPEPS